MRCDERLRGRLLSNIVLTGGNSLLPNLNVRLQVTKNCFFKGGFRAYGKSLRLRKKFALTDKLAPSYS
jgi:hypothetical protein